MPLKDSKWKSYPPVHVTKLGAGIFLDGYYKDITAVCGYTTFLQNVEPISRAGLTFSLAFNDLKYLKVWDEDATEELQWSGVVDHLH